MPPPRVITPDIREAVIKLHKRGLLIREIAAELRMNASTIGGLVAKLVTQRVLKSRMGHGLGPLE